MSKNTNSITLENRTQVRIACTLMSALFLISGIRKLLTWSATAGYFSALGLPFPAIVVPLVILLELGGAVALISGWRRREVASILAVYTLVTAFIAHRFWAADPAQFNPQLNNFFKNIAMVGGFLLLIMQPAAARR
ncbi:DoxX family protein [Trinickia violacea]|uniref:DoxX family protein n=1 Tax=Trinickia violacea TaxID=2571746 RepID=A0A4P8IYM5_9BURK|nr:DoxX family protein [Trinickia violacea]QCP52673.1 DoxX family protein [Trinickia violacea]